MARLLLILVPFYIMRYERDIENDPQAAIDACMRVRLALEETLIAGKIDKAKRDRLFELCIDVSDFVLRKHQSLAKKARDIMGGEVIEFMDERHARELR